MREVVELVDKLTWRKLLEVILGKPEDHTRCSVFMVLHLSFNAISVLTLWYPVVPLAELPAYPFIRILLGLFNKGGCIERRVVIHHP